MSINQKYEIKKELRNIYWNIYWKRINISSKLDKSTKDLYEHQENLLKMEKSSERLKMIDNLKVNIKIKINMKYQSYRIHYIWEERHYKQIFYLGELWRKWWLWKEKIFWSY